jgi:hypothetical protein
VTAVANTNAWRVAQSTQLSQPATPPVLHSLATAPAPHPRISPFTGLGVTLAKGIPWSVVYFGATEFWSHRLWDSSQPVAGTSDSKSPPLQTAMPLHQVALAGMLGAVTASVVATPFEILRARWLEHRAALREALRRRGLFAFVRELHLVESVSNRVLHVAPRVAIKKLTFPLVRRALVRMAAPGVRRASRALAPVVMHSIQAVLRAVLRKGG